MKIIKIFTLFLTVLLLAKAFAKDKKLNVVFVFADQLRMHSVAYSGLEDVYTPNLDAIAKMSKVFKNAVSVTPVCTPWRASFISGQYPLTTGMIINDIHLPNTAPSVAEPFKKSGYQTAYIGKWHINGGGRESFIEKKDRRGFDYWKVLECTHTYLKSAYYDNDDRDKKYWEGYDAFAQTSAAIDFLKTPKDKPFFLVLSYGIPHFPHGTALEEYRNMYPLDKLKLPPNVPEVLNTNKTRLEYQGYLAHISALDKCIGEIFEELKRQGLLENTVFIFTSDHGEAMGSHGCAPWQKQVFWAESARVPLLIYVPTAKSGVLNRPITTPDITTTLISLAGLGVPEIMEGKDFSQVILDRESDSDSVALYMNALPFSYAVSEGAYRAIKTSQFTYVETKKGETFLFDDIADVYQQKNLANLSENFLLAAKLKEALYAELKKYGDTFETEDFYLKKYGFDKYVLPQNVFPSTPKTRAAINFPEGAYYTPKLD